MEMINGFQCKTCTDVDYAKKHIDPAHPKDGPYGVNARDKVDAREPVEGRAAPEKTGSDPAFRLDGRLAGLNDRVAPIPPATRVGQPGGLVNLTV